MGQTLASIATSPRLPMVAIGLALVTALSAAVIGPSAVGGPSMPPASRLLAERTLRFEDRPDKSVVVLDGQREVAVFQGEQGFVRGILRAFARTRRADGASFAQPFHLAGWADGRITMDDPATGVRLDLEAYGHDNAAVFARLLQLQVRQP